MTQHQILCRFFAVGACKKGEHCQFSHDPTSRPSYVCSFFLRGNCQFGSHCRYEHVNPRDPGHGRASEGSSSHSAARTAPAQPVHREVACSSSSQGDRPQHDRDPEPRAGSSDSAWFTDEEARSHGVDAPFVAGGSGESVSAFASGESLSAFASGESSSTFAVPLSVAQKGAEHPICTAFSVNGSCRLGAACPKVHGSLCPFCEKRCIHPFRPLEAEEHMKTCERKQKRLEALLQSQEVECSVCLEKVLSKPSVPERKFGIMSHCDHAFCIMCIRGWRQGSHGSHMDVDTVVRACPVCRVQSHYITPSMVWFFSPEEKEGIIAGYKSKLKSVNCKYHQFGESKCPFGSSCFYRHASRDGILEETRVRHLGGGDGTVIAKDVRLSDFLEELNLNGTSRRGH